MAQITLDTVFRYPVQLIKFLRTQFERINTMFGEVYDQEIVFPVTLHASKTIHNIYLAPRAVTVVSIEWVSDVAQAITGTVVKATGTATPAVGTTPMHTANAIVINTTAHTPLPITLTSTVANLALADGDRIALVLNSALTTGSGVLTIRIKH